MRAFLWWLSGLLPCRFINDGDTRYLERYYVGRLFGLTFYLHRFVASDPDRGKHSHPWKTAWSIILSGWYFEERMIGVHAVRWFNRLTYESFHRVILPMDLRPDQGDDNYDRVTSILRQPGGKPPKECWTLFFHTAGRPNNWGFLRQLADGSGTFQPFEYGKDNDSKKTPTDEWWKTSLPGRKRNRTSY